MILNLLIYLVLGALLVKPLSMLWQLMLERRGLGRNAPLRYLVAYTPALRKHLPKTPIIGG